MAWIGLIEILVATACFILIRMFTNAKDGLPTSWPLLGMMPSLFLNFHRVHDWTTELLERKNCTFFFQGFWFTNTSYFVTADPANIQHIMTTNFVNFPKGPGFMKIFSILGNGLVNVDSGSWMLQRKAIQGHLTHVKFQRFLGKVTRDKIENGLMKVFDKLAENDVEADLQDLFQRLTFDMTFKFVTGFDPRCLCDDFPEVVIAKALDNAEEAIFYRHIFPEWWLRLQRILGIGTEEKHRIAQRDLDQILATYIQIKREQLRKPSLDTNEEADCSDLLTSYMLDGKYDDKFLRDTILNLIIAGRDTISSTLTWFFYNLSENPSVEAKIREEIRSLIPHEKKINLRVFQDKLLLDKMVYLHGALCESLRLYPPTPYQQKCPTGPDILPSGHRVDANRKILMHLYSMGRMKSTWGEDCSKFRPERWISEKGGIKHEPSYKFLSFNAGPRTCLGKDVAFTQMKTVAAAILHEYEVRLVEGQKVVPASSLILQMRHGLKVKIIRRK